MQGLMIRAAIESCRRQGWRLHGSGSDVTHMHFVLSWPEFQDCDEVIRRLKNGLSYVLGRDVGPRGRKWFVRGGSKKRVKDKAHFDHLLETYFPDHPGVYWREGMPLP
jgi:hypothetical protein